MARYTAKYEEPNGLEFARETYTGTLDYAIECARAYCVAGERFKLYENGGLVWSEEKEGRA